MRALRRRLSERSAGCLALVALVIVIGVVGTGHGSRADRHPTVATNGPVPAAAPAIVATEVVNATRGGVSDAEAHVWAAAYEASLRWMVLAIEGQRPELVGALTVAHRVDARTLKLIATTRAQHLKLSYSSSPRLTRLLLVALSPSQQATVADDGGEPAPYAWLASYVGPIALVARSPDGTTTTYPVLAAGATIDELSVGFLVTDPSLGPIWREGYSRDCLADPDSTLCP